MDPLNFIRMTILILFTQQKVIRKMNLSQGARTETVLQRIIFKGIEMTNFNQRIITETPPEKIFKRGMTIKSKTVISIQKM